MNAVGVLRRSTIAHELVNDERRVFPIDAHLRAREETAVEQIAARRLIALEQLAEAMRWPRNGAEATDELWGDVPMLMVLIQF
ncbi:hypothetical protein [Jongsikchunia kroppenstedtii]|uniref:hypothetical protein n=1 Tax=Jongsikchunia kroppenstedtii TaxID=1121721 RepID=UPI000380CCA4|nr:hypothetical protein [Jongsikchunia kroppenstedtii]